MRYEPPKQDKPMVISVVTAEYKVERVLIAQGSSANILFWSTCKRLGLQLADLEACVGKLYGFASEVGDHVRRKHTRAHHPSVVHGRRCRCVLQHNHGKTDPEQVGSCSLHPPFMHEVSCGVGGRKSMGRPSGRQTMCEDERERPLRAEDLKEVSIGPKLVHKTEIGMALA
ncbi:hypothetical protein CR513_01974, partial [Mucuna pruriens]